MLKKYIAPLILAVATFFIYMYTAAPLAFWEDAGRILAAIKTLGIAIPPEPVYVFLAHWFTYLPFGSLVFRVQIFSAILAAASLILLYRLVAQIIEHMLADECKRHAKQWQYLKHHGRKEKEEYESQDSTRHRVVIISGIFSMLTLGFSYQFWSQAQNIEAYILASFMVLLILNLLSVTLTNSNKFKISASVALICGLMTGVHTPTLMAIVPSVIFVIWVNKSTLGKKRLKYTFLIGLLGVLIPLLYFPLSQSQSPLLNQANGFSLQSIIEISTGQGLNVYDPSLALKNGLTWSPKVVMEGIWRYLTMFWLSFTPILIPFIALGAILLWRIQRKLFTIFFLIIPFNMTLSSIYFSGNQESYHLPSHIVFALFAGLGFYWLTKILSKKWTTTTSNLFSIIIFLLAFIPLIYWWPTLNRREWTLSKEYMENLYKPIQGPAIVIGSGDLFEALSNYIYTATDYKHDIVPVYDTALYSSEWKRHIWKEKSGIHVPDGSKLTHDSLEEYNKFMSDFITGNMPKYRIYITQNAINNSFFGGASGPSLKIDQERFSLIPEGMLTEIVPKNQERPLELKNFDYHFTNDFPSKRPQYLENSYKNEVQSIINEMAGSYDNAANYLTNQKKYPEALKFYEKALVLTPKNHKLLSDLGIYYGSQDKFEKALDYFNQALSIDENNPAILFNIAITNERLGKIDEERKYLDRILSIKDADPMYVQMAQRQLSTLNGQGDQSANQASNLPAGFSYFKDESLNLQFIYPQNLKVEKINDNIAALYDPSRPTLAEKLQIYSSTGVNIDDMNNPFSQKEQLLNKEPISLPRFKALVKTYPSPSGVEQLLFMQKDQQAFVIKFPAGNAFDQNVINSVIQSINTIR